MSKTSYVFAGLTAAAVVAGVVTLCLQPAADSVAAIQPAAATQPASADAAVARLGELVVTPDELKGLLATLPPASRAQVLGNRATLEALVRSRLAEKAVLQQASAQGWPERAEVQAQARAATEQIVLRDYLASVSQVPADYPSAQDLQQAYQANLQALQMPARYRVSQIYLANAEGAGQEAVHKQAQEVSKKAQAANADFAALARQYSQDAQSAAQGGDIGLLPLAQLQPGVRDVVARLKEGGVSEPIKDTSGYHILKLVDVQPARPATLDEVRDSLTASLRNVRQQQIAKAYLEGMFTTATLSIDGTRLNQVIKDTQHP